MPQLKLTWAVLVRAGLWQQLGSELLVNVAQGCCTSLWKFLTISANCSKIQTIQRHHINPHKSSGVIRCHQIVTSDLQCLRRRDHTLVLSVTSGLEVQRAAWGMTDSICPVRSGCFREDPGFVAWLCQRQCWARLETGFPSHFLSCTILQSNQSSITVSLATRHAFVSWNILEPCHHLVQ